MPDIEYLTSNNSGMSLNDASAIVQCDANAICQDGLFVSEAVAKQHKSVRLYYFVSGGQAMYMYNSKQDSIRTE